MRKNARIFSVVLVLSMILPWVANAVSWSPDAAEREEKSEKGIKVAGEVVCLFQSGTKDVKKEIRINDILVVFRENRDHKLKEVGKIKILFYIGEDFLKGILVEGEAGPGDIAKKGEVASLVITPTDSCK